MGQQTLAVKYRPKTFEDVTEQSYIKSILENQIKSNEIKNAYLFCGGAGTGKTTTARIFANEINKGQGNPIEVDAASNNGVEQIRVIIDDAKFKSLESEYKIYILDECHMLSTGAWNAMLKLLEEPPKTTIFILCTTDPQKIPATILSRVQRYDFQKISFEGIVSRLMYIIEAENDGNKVINTETGSIDYVNFIDFDVEALKYIAKIADGGMRDAISLLDKCISFSNDLSINNVINILGVSDYNNLNGLLHNIVEHHVKETINNIENIYRSGKDLKQFLKQLIAFLLDVCKYQIYNSYDYIQIPNTINLDEYKNIEYNFLIDILDKLLKLNNDIKYETNPKILIESNLLLIIRKEVEKNENAKI